MHNATFPRYVLTYCSHGFVINHESSTDEGTTVFTGPDATEASDILAAFAALGRRTHTTARARARGAR